MPTLVNKCDDEISNLRLVADEIQCHKSAGSCTHYGCPDVSGMELAIAIDN